MRGKKPNPAGYLLREISSLMRSSKMGTMKPFRNEKQVANRSRPMKDSKCLNVSAMKHE